MIVSVVWILDSSGKPAAVLDPATLGNLRYERMLNEVSVAQFTLPAEHAACDLLTKHVLFEVYRYPTPSTEQKEHTYMVVYRDTFLDDDGREWLIVSGFSLEFLLLQRHVDPRNDPLMAGGYSTKSDAADTVMYELVHQQAGSGASTHGGSPSQQVAGLTAIVPAGVGVTVPVRLAWENLLETLQNIASGDRMDFRIERSAGANLNFVAEVIGSDKSKTTHWPGEPFVMLQPELGKMVSPRLKEDWREEKTVIHLLGRGAGENRDYYGSVASNYLETPYSYASAVEDLRAAETAAEYVEQAYQALSKHRATKQFTFEVKPSSDYRDLWDVGDIITGAWKDFEDDLRISGIVVDIEAGTETVSPILRGRYE